MEKSLPAIPAKRYFTIGEVSDLCGVKPYVLRYWEQEFTQLKPMKRRGNRRYYQHHEVLLIRRIRELLYDQGFTISGARNRLGDVPVHEAPPDDIEVIELTEAALAIGVDDAQLGEVLGGTSGDALEGQWAASPDVHGASSAHADAAAAPRADAGPPLSAAQVRAELLSIRGLLIA
jgi:DNA-binding transcriptional MerR regulator